ncbi:MULTISPECIES: TonB-dependent receptor [unclassified Sphingomonas]|uniref:TonB-dependent receptor n=2 Tax=Sphingomonas TaxID=13687 RepID=UPI0006F919C4|nr:MULTISPECIES: TonB-dependent receptor [unclassified Sphingomonas]KQY66603.1 ligand-gated channel protein [Sphingomonas sp. Root50]KRB90073.1 ligand-gated channel protein [Sphingomonas sp. Root720]
MKTAPRPMHRWVKLALLAGTMLAPVAAMAQDAADDTGEIVVTAQKREQKLQDIGLSVTAIGGAMLDAVGRQDMTALAAQVPGLQVASYSPTITVFNIRGVSQNDFADSQEAPIAFYNDEVYVSALGAISGQMFDLERMEILRGPQGTLFGRNATGGLVQAITKRPTRELEGYATLTVGSYGQIASEGAISGPLSERVRARLSFTSDHHGGYIENRVGRDIGNARFYGGRLQVEADVGDSGTLLVKLQGLRNDHETSGGLYSHVAAGFDADGLGFALGPNEDFWGTCGGCDAFGYKEPDKDPFTGSFDRIGFFDRKYWSATVRYEQDFGGAKLTSITDYQDLRKRFGEDSDMQPSPIFHYDTAQDLYQLSQELRLSGDTDRFTWLAGVYGLKIKTDNDYQIDAAPILGLLENYGGRQKTDSIAFFGQAEYKLSDLLSFTVGGRYSWDRKTYDFAHAENGVQDFVFNRATDPDLAKQTFKNWSGKVQVDYRPTDDVLIYASVNRGTKSGGFGVQAFTPIDPATLPYDQEVLTNYEAGYKLTLLDRKVTFNGAIFHYDYKDYQAFTLQGLSQIVANVPARVTGIESELVLRPARGLMLSGFLTWLDTKVKGITLPSGRVTDRKMPQAPKWSIGGMARYAFPVGPGQLALQTDWKYDASLYFSTFNAPIDRESSRIVGNARISWATDDDHWTIAAFVNNLTDKEYRIYNLDLGASFGFANQSYARPRWFGGSVGYSF